MDDNPGPDRGPALEEKVHQLLKRLEAVGLVADIRKPDHVTDWHGNTRRLDMSFWLTTVAVHVLVNIECKSRQRTITIDEIDQIKTFKNDVIGRNVFWLVYEGTLSETVEKTLANCGISFYSIERLEEIINSMVAALNDRADELKRVIAAMEPFRTMAAGICTMYARQAWEIAVQAFPASTGRFVHTYTGPKPVGMSIEGHGYDGTWLVGYRSSLHSILPKKDAVTEGGETA